MISCVHSPPAVVFAVRTCWVESTCICSRFLQPLFIMSKWWRYIFLLSSVSAFFELLVPSQYAYNNTHVICFKIWLWAWVPPAHNKLNMLQSMCQIWDRNLDLSLWHVTARLPVYMLHVTLHTAVQSTGRTCSHADVNTALRKCAFVIVLSFFLEQVKREGILEIFSASHDRPHVSPVSLVLA